jgi:hypothetical protein
MRIATTFWRAGEAADGRSNHSPVLRSQALAIRWRNGALHSTLETNGIPCNSLKTNKSVTRDPSLVLGVRRLVVRRLFSL